MEVERSARVLDGVLVVLDGVAGNKRVPPVMLILALRIN